MLPVLFGRKQEVPQGVGTTRVGARRDHSQKATDKRTSDVRSTSRTSEPNT